MNLNENNLDYNLELLKRCLIGVIDPEIKHLFLNNKLNQEDIIKYSNVEIPYKRLHGHDMSPDNTETMTGYLRLSNLQSCMLDVIKNNISGDFIETGVWKGGSCIFAKKILDKNSIKKQIFVADSFCGVPPPDTERYHQDSGDDHYKIESLKISCDAVKDNFKKYNCFDESIIFLEGIFKDTLPTIKDTQLFSIIRLDGDMYSSTMDSMNNLYPKLSKGGYVIIDDFNVKRCRQAIEDFRNANNINSEIITIDDGGGVFWKK